MPIDGHVLLRGGNHRVGITERGVQVGIQGGLIAFDGQHTGPRARMNLLHEVGVSRPRISRVDARAPRLARKERFGDGDLVGFLRNAYLEQRFLTGMGTEGKPLRRLVRGLGRSAYRFAVQSHASSSLGGRVALTQAASASSMCPTLKRGKRRR